MNGIERLALAGLGAVSAGGAAYGQALNVADTVRMAPGRWELDPAEVADAQRGALTCDDAPLEIRITEGDGGLRYEAERVGEEGAARASDVLSVPARSGRPLMAVRYDDEQTVDAYGRPVAWVLEMPDPNHFYWIRSDRLMTHPIERSSMYRRCPGAVS